MTPTESCPLWNALELVAKGVFVSHGNSEPHPFPKQKENAWAEGSHIQEEESKYKAMKLRVSLLFNIYEIGGGGKAWPSVWTCKLFQNQTLYFC